jgi:hypothetical protein
MLLSPKEIQPKLPCVLTSEDELLHKYDIKSADILANFEARLGAFSFLLGAKYNILCKSACQ